MKRLLLLLMLMIGTEANAFIPNFMGSLVFHGLKLHFTESVPEQIEVTAIGTGKTREAAIENALIAAVQEAIGVLVVSDQTVDNSRVVRDLAATYSSGVVNEYKIIECRETTPVRCRIQAKVSPWNFQRKLMGDSSTIVISGSDMLAQYQSSKNTLIQRQKLTKYYLSQIQQSGLEVKILELKVVPSTNDKVTLVIDYRVQWNPEFKKSMISFLEKLEKDTNGRKTNNNQVYIQWGPTGWNENRVFINAYDPSFQKMMMNYMYAPLRVSIDELGTCDRFEVNNGLFAIDWLGFRQQKVLTVEPDKLKNLSKLSMTTECKGV